MFIPPVKLMPVTLLILSSTEKYNGVLDEFMSAHEHYRNKKYKETLNDCLKSFESLMKAIHEKRNWAYTPNDTAKYVWNAFKWNKIKQSIRCLCCCIIKKFNKPNMSSE